jgi:hypothetical protein
MLACLNVTVSVRQASRINERGMLARFPAGLAERRRAAPARGRARLPFWRCPTAAIVLPRDVSRQARLTPLPARGVQPLRPRAKPRRATTPANGQAMLECRCLAGPRRRDRRWQDPRHRAGLAPSRPRQMGTARKACAPARSSAPARRHGTGPADARDTVLTVFAAKLNCHRGARRSLACQSAEGREGSCLSKRCWICGNDARMGERD